VTGLEKAEAPAKLIGARADNGASDPRRSASRGFIAGIVMVALFMSSVDTTIVATALPAIHRGLHSTINWAGWTITIYGLGVVVSLPTAGRVADQLGRRRVFLWAIALFTISSLACGFATNIYMLIVFRAIQALGGGAMQPSAAGIVADQFGKDRDRALAFFGSVAALGQVVGPVFGGLFVGYLSWRWIFFVNVPVGVAMIVLVGRYIGESARGARQRIDVPGLVMLVSFVLASILAITDLGGRHTALSDPAVLVPAIGAVVVFVLVISHQRRTNNPFMPAHLLRGRGFGLVNGLNFLWGFAGFGPATLAPLYAEDRYHFHALDAGTLLTARAVGMTAVGTLAAITLRRTGYRLPLFLGYSIVAIGSLMMSIAPRGLSVYAWLTIAAGLTGLGNGFANPALRNACLNYIPDEVAASTGLRFMFNNIGTIFSVSIITAILNRSGDPGITQAHIMWLMSIVLVAMLALAARVPEHKGTW
jgi:EmrB/QacA subfamily drug resistance transporter